MPKKTVNVRPASEPVPQLLEPVWEQQPGESVMWFTRFLRYLHAEGARKMRQVYEAECAESGKEPSHSQQAPSVWGYASRYWRWEERCLAWDRMRLKLRTDAEEDIKEQMMTSPLAQRWGRLQHLTKLFETLQEQVYEKDKRTGELVNLWRITPVSVRSDHGWVVGDKREFNDSLIVQFRGVLDDIASEMGQRKDYSDIIDVRVWSPEQWQAMAQERLGKLRALTDRFAVAGLLEDQADEAE